MVPYTLWGMHSAAPPPISTRPRRSPGPTRRPTRRRLGVAAAAVGLALGAAACSSSTSPSAGADPSPSTAGVAGPPAPAGAAPTAGVAAATAARQEGRTVIDVRTPAEFAAGHVDGARNVDLQDADFAATIAALDRAGDYVVYCRSGNRSAQAAAQMRQANLDVYDGGGLQDMRQAGWTFTS